MFVVRPYIIFFFFNDTATTEIYTLSYTTLFRSPKRCVTTTVASGPVTCAVTSVRSRGDRKSTRLNSSHGYISYAVFCLKKKKKYTHKHRSPLELNKQLDVASDSCARLPETAVVY